MACVLIWLNMLILDVMFLEKEKEMEEFVYLRPVLKVF